MGTGLRGVQIADGSVGRPDLNTTISGQAVTTKLIGSNGVAVLGTGIDPGTGDVTLSADLTFLDTKYASIVTSRTQNFVLAAPSSGAGAATFRALVAGDIPAIAISGVTGLQTALNAKISGSGTTNYLAKYTGSLTQGVSQIIDNGTSVGIGTAFPDSGYKFDVNGTVKANGFNIGGASSYTLDMGLGPAIDNAADITTSANLLKFFSFQSFTWSNLAFPSVVQRMKLDVNGLKIGTGTAAYPLDVTGAGNFSGSLYVASQFGVGTTAPTGKVDVFTGATGDLAGYAIFRTNTGTALQGGILVSNSVATSGNSFKISSSFNGSSSATARMGFVSNNATETFLNSGAALWFQYNGDVLAVPSGNFGIGALNSSYKLNVIGAVHVTGNTIIDSNLGVGTTALTGNNLRVSRPITGSGTSIGIRSDGQVQDSGGITTAYYYRSDSATDSALALTTLIHYGAAQGTLAGSVTSQIGFNVASTFLNATNNYAFVGGINSAVNAWNIYMSGTASNYIAGKLGIGTTTLTQANINITLPLTGNATYYGVQNVGIVQSDVTANAVYFRTNAATLAVTAPNAYTVTNLVHFGAYRGTIGANSTITNQFGFFVDSTVVGAGTANYAFYSGIGSGATNWGFYSAGAANNHFNGNVWIGTNTGSYKLDVNGDARFVNTVQFDAVPTCSISATVGNQLVNLTTLLQYASGIRYDQNKIKTVAMTNITPLSGHKTINGYTTSGTTDRVLLMGQSNPIENGIYIANSSTWTRDPNYNEDPEMRGAIHTIELGAYAGYKYVNTNTSAITINTTNITYSEFSNLVETDPVFTAHAAYGVTTTKIGNWDAAYAYVNGTKLTTNIVEGSNLYFTAARVLATSLTGLTTGTNIAITATDSIISAFQNVQAQLNNKLSFGGDTRGALISVGTNDNFDFNLERNNSIQMAIKSGVIEANFDFDIKGKLKLNGSTGVDHQFVKYNGTSTVWATLNTGELSDANNIMMLEDIAGERGFQMFSDSAKTYADAFVYTNSVAGIALGLHGYANDATTHTIKEFGLELDVDGYLYHQKTDGNRFKIATIDMLSGGNTTWNGGAVTNDILIDTYTTIFWNKVNTDYDVRMYGYNSVGIRGFQIESAYDIGIRGKWVELISGKYPGGSVNDDNGVVIDGVLFDLQNVNLLVGGNAKFAISNSTSSTKFRYKATLIAG